jgi:hypothetical protein
LSQRGNDRSNYYYNVTFKDGVGQNGHSNVISRRHDEKSLRRYLHQGGGRQLEPPSGDFILNFPLTMLIVVAAQGFLTPVGRSK